MTHREARSYFVREIIPSLNEPNGPDYPMRRQAWNEWVDILQRDGDIDNYQAMYWSQPSCCLKQRGP